MIRDLLDLAYPAPRTSPAFASRVLTEGRRLRRRRRLALGGAATLLAAGAMSLLALRPWEGNGLFGPHGPAGTTSFAAALGQLTEQERTALMQGPGSVGRLHQVSSDGHGEATLLWLTPSGQLCVGSRKAGAADASPEVCSPLDALPASGLARNETFVMNPDPAHPDIAPGTLLFGLARGDVTSVRLSGRGLGSVTAHLERVDPRGVIGALYWYLVPPGTVTADDIIRSAFHDGTQVYSCTGLGCQGKNR